MARTITEIKKSLMDKVAADAVLGPLLTSTSAVAVYGAFLYIASFAAWTVENLHDLFKADVNATIAEKNPHSARWYVNKVKEFQYGFNLVPEKDYYDNTGIAQDVIDASKIIAYASFVQEPETRLKLAKNVGTGLGKLSNTELTAAIEYVMRFKDAGVKLKRTTLTVPTTITSNDPDQLYIKMDVYFNPLVLGITGNRLDGTIAAPVPSAIRNYISNIDFDGVFSVQKLVDAVQAVDGVKDLFLETIQTQYGALPFTSVAVDFIPDAGYLVIDDANLLLTFIPA
jgi:hypothetical protein